MHAPPPAKRPYSSRALENTDLPRGAPPGLGYGSLLDRPVNAQSFLTFGEQFLPPTLKLGNIILMDIFAAISPLFAREKCSTGSNWHGGSLASHDRCNWRQPASAGFGPTRTFWSASKPHRHPQTRPGGLKAKQPGQPQGEAGKLTRLGKHFRERVEKCSERNARNAYATLTPGAF